MSQSKTVAGHVLAALLVGGYTSPGSSAGPVVPRGFFQVRVPDRAGTAVRRALDSARRRLGEEPCRSVLADFNVPEGESLGAVLERRGQSAEEHLDTIVFRDGSGRPRCERPGILAFTHVGGDTIFVCTGSFGRAAERDPRFAEIVVIHEVLHTIGLAENPPTSGDITAHVARRCGS